MRLNHPLTFEEIHQFWLERVKVIKSWLKFEMDVSENKQLQLADPRFSQPMLQKYAYFSNNKIASGLICIENAIELIKAIYLKDDYVSRPTWLDDEAIMRLRAEYRLMPGLRFRPEMRFSANRELNKLWQSVEKDIIDYLQVRFSEHRDLFQQLGMILPAEQAHLCCFIDSLGVIRDQLKQSQMIFSELERPRQRNQFAAEETVRIKIKLQWVASVLKSLVLVGNENRYLTTTSDLLPLPDRIENFLFFRQRLELIKQQSSTISYYSDLFTLFSDCRKNINAKVETLNRTCDQIDAFVLTQQPKTGDHSKTAVNVAIANESVDIYTVMGVDRDATEAEINSAYKKRALRVHPDKKGGNVKWMQRLGNAHLILLNPEERAALDKKLDFLEELEDDTLAFEAFSSVDKKPLSQIYRAQHLKLKAQYQKKPLTMGSTYDPTYDHFTPLDIPSPLYQRQGQYTVQRVVVHKKQQKMPRWLRPLPKLESHELSVDFIQLLIPLMGIFAEEYRAGNLTSEFSIGKVIGYCFCTVLLLYSFKELLHSVFYSIQQKNQKTSTVTEIVDDVITETIEADDIFSFLEDLELFSSLNEIEFMGRLTPHRAITLFQNYLKGDYVGQSLENLRDCFFSVINLLPSSNPPDEWLLYSGILEVISRDELDDALPLIVALQKITDFAKIKTHEVLPILTPLFEDRYYRILFAQAMMDYWHSPLSITDICPVFDGREKILQEIATLIESDSIKPEDIHHANSLKLLLQFDELLYEGHHSEKRKWTAEAYREKAYFCLDAIKTLAEILNPIMRLNLIIQGGVYFQCASCSPGTPAEQMANQRSALDMYATAISIAEKGSPDITLYVYLETLRYIANFQFRDPALSTMIAGYQHRALFLADLFPFFQTHQPHVNFLDGNVQHKYLIQHYLLALVDRIGITPVDVVKVLYMAYESCVRGWYPVSERTMLSEQFRERLIRELLGRQHWIPAHVNRNIDFPSIMIDRNEEGWLRPAPTLPLPEHQSITTFQSINGFELNHDTGQITFFVEAWSEHDAPYKRHLTHLDMVDMLEKNITEAWFSLDPVDPDLRYHPFNNMRYSPNTLHGSELLNTMFITDYLLKFFTVGVQVQGQLPYAMRSVNELIAHLPPHLQKIITDFHHHPVTEESIHRFWIEAGDFPIGLPNAGIAGGNVELVLLGKLNMIVKKHLLKRDAEGNLIDDPDEKGEGWPLYVINLADIKRWQDNPSVDCERAILFIHNKKVAYFFEDGNLSDYIKLRINREELNPLFEVPREADGKIIKSIYNSYFLLNLVRTVTAAADRPHHFTPEYIFAEEFTAHYDEFAEYFPEFGRLKSLTRIVILIRYLNAVRDNNETKIERLNALLNDPQSDESWIKEKAKSFARRLSISYRSLIARGLAPVRSYRTMARLKVYPHSEEILVECKKIYKQEKKSYVKQHGFLSRFDKACPTEKAIIEKESTAIAASLSAKRLEAFKTGLVRQYVRKLRRGFSKTISEQCVDAYLDGNEAPLGIALAIANGYSYLDLLILRDSFGIPIIEDDLLLIFLGNKTKTLEIVKQIHRQGDRSPLMRAWNKEREKTKLDLKNELAKRLAFQKSLEQIGLGPSDQEKDLDGICTWVPAAISSGLSGNRYRFVYGGVSLYPNVQEHRNSPIAQSMAREIANNERIVRMSANDLAASGREVAHAMPTTRIEKVAPHEFARISTTSIAQQCRFFQAEEARRRRPSRHHAAERGQGSSAGSKAGSGAAAVGGGGRRPPGGGEPPGGWTIKARLKAVQLPTEGKIRFIPRAGYRPSKPLDRGSNHGYFDKFGNEWIKGPSRTLGEPFEWDVQLSPLGKKRLGHLSRDGDHINVSLRGRITHR